MFYLFTISRVSCSRMAKSGMGRTSILQGGLDFPRCSQVPGLVLRIEDILCKGALDIKGLHVGCTYVAYNFLVVVHP